MRLTLGALDLRSDAMAKLKLSYFDFPGGRGEDCRMALFAAGVDFEDHRLKSEEWGKLKTDAPYGALPMLTLEGKPVLAQSNAILTYIGEKHGLLPSDAWDKALHLAVMEAVEELRAAIDPSSRIKDEAEKERVRKELSTGYMQRWGAQLEKQIQGPFVAGTELGVADLKLFTCMNWLKKGVLDYIPTDVLKDFPKLEKLFEAVAAHPKIAEWRARFA